MCGLTFELSGRQRQDARPGLRKCTAYRQTGPGGLPLALRLSEGLGHKLVLDKIGLPRCADQPMIDALAGPKALSNEPERLKLRQVHARLGWTYSGEASNLIFAEPIARTIQRQQESLFVFWQST